ncbi:MAG TPA: hypothetical protein PLA50_02720 [Bacteroidia bacterium]|nr:hypothetical protein [Bacteroidia bacterium]
MSATRLGQGPKTVQECQGLATRNFVTRGDPTKSPHTLPVCFAIAAGYRWGAPKPYLDATEEIGGELVRHVHWCFDSESTAMFDGVRVPLGEFFETLIDGKPCLAETLAALRTIYLETVHYPDPARWASILREKAPAYPRLAEILSRAAKIHEEFVACPPRRFLLYRRARGRTETRVYIPLHASKEEREKLLRDAGLL